MSESLTLRDQNFMILNEKYFYRPDVYTGQNRTNSSRKFQSKTSNQISKIYF